jgi:putative ABC transport system substrate-binding protein
LETCLTASRLVVIVSLILAHLAAPLATEAQEAGKVYRVGILPPGPISERLHLWKAFRQGLRDLGYVEGENITLVFPAGEVRPERLSQLAAELVSLKVDVIVAAATAGIQAARKATTTIPIVMPVANDPVETGFVASLGRPGGNITGLALISSQLSGKRLELLRTVAPEVSRIAVLFNPTNPALPHQIRETEAAARALGVHLQLLEVRDPKDIDKALQIATTSRTHALVVLDDALLFTYRTTIVKLAAKNRLAAIYGFREFVEAGGLMAYAANLADMYRRAATYVDRILKGAKPADLPIEQPTTFELVINLKTAKALGLTIPPAVLARADEIIE